MLLHSLAELPAFQLKIGNAAHCISFRARVQIKQAVVSEKVLSNFKGVKQASDDTIVGEPK
jgi:hypothetical protein